MLRFGTSFCMLLLCLEVCLGTEEKLLKTQQDPKCLLPMETGPCRMSLERYYYNTKTNACETFKFGGCRGNDNKFGFRKTCEDACVVPARPLTNSRAPATVAMTSSKSSTTRPTLTNAATPAPTPAAAAVKNNNKNVKNFIA